jgi:putative ABC transport system permease protein
VMVALIASTITIHRQTRFAIEDQLRVPGDQMYLMELGCAFGFRDDALRIPGIRAATCSSDRTFTTGYLSSFTARSGGSVNLREAMIETGFFEMFGIQPLAGRLFDEQHGEDHVARDASATANPSFILNESAARALGYANPADAVGKTHHWSRPTFRRNAQGQIVDFVVLEAQASQVVGVVPDFVVGSIRNAIEPTAFLIDPNMAFMLLLKLDGNTIPATMRALETTWKSRNDAPSLPGRFMSQIIEDRYADIRRQTTLFAAFSAIAIVVASLGLLGLAVFTAERRTREIGLRKVMGATRSDILRFIGWQFTRPVVLANLIAWPSAWFFLRRWLEGFAYHVDLGPMAFLAASALALLIALITVSGHALLVARARPAEALRYE